MKRLLLIFYAMAIGLHATILFCLKPPAPIPPKILNETYVDVALTVPPTPSPPKPQPPLPSPPPKVEPPPKPEEKPPPLAPKPEITIPAPKPQPPKQELPKPEPPKPRPSPPPVAKSVIIPQPKSPPQEYVSVTEPSYAERVQPIYPEQARRRHQQGIAVLALYINESGALDKVEIIKSSGHPLLDEAAINAVKRSRFDPALQGATPVRSRAEVKVTFRLE